MVEEVEKDITELTAEEKAAQWAAWVRSEVNAALNIYLDKAITGNINIKYYPHVVERLESGPVLSKTNMDGVLISVEFIFEEPIDISKPRIKEE